MAGSFDVRVDQRGVAYATLDHRAKLNTLNAALMGEVITAMAELAGRGELRCAVLTGAGERAFIGGADIREMAAIGSPAEAAAFIRKVHGVCDAMRALPVPVIARIEGFCLGAGLEVAASCDLRIASDSARFGMPEVRVGIPSVVEAALLPGLIGWGRTRRLLLLGETLDARTMEAWGFLEQVTQQNALNYAVEAAVAMILEAGPAAIRAQKALIREWEGLPMDAAIQAGITAFAASFAGDEPRRMLGCFLDALAARKAAGDP
ncbi:enoyl-CoA hydratase [Plastoroseomonas arctica]|uniref:Enoyl-CoA hydratase n=1 Tax=Plastoroseomonas arctica TaxID=1509237 RepID=A0AAF1K1E8_9PROT|nr:enoyl-CoA hydratase [Plastoroseomonas arctica]